MNITKVLCSACVVGSLSLSLVALDSREETLVEVTHVIRCDRNQPVVVNTRIEIPATIDGQILVQQQEEDPDFNVTDLLQDNEIRAKKDNAQNSANPRISSIEDTNQYTVLTIKTGSDYDFKNSSLIESTNGELRLVLGKKHDTEKK